MQLVPTCVRDGLRSNHAPTRTMTDCVACAGSAEQPARDVTMAHEPYALSCGGAKRERQHRSHKGRLSGSHTYRASFAA